MRGVKVCDTKRGKKFERTNVISARFKTSDGEVKHCATYCYTHNTDSAFFEEWFRKVLVKSIVRGSTIILDNASFHRKTKLKNLARRHGMKIMFLPAYSPDLNPIETDWANMKSALVDIIPIVGSVKAAVCSYFGIDIS